MLTWIHNISFAPGELLRNNPDRIAFLSQADIDHFESVFCLFDRTVLARAVRLDGRPDRAWFSWVDPYPSIKHVHDDFGCRANRPCPFYLGCAD